MSEARRRLRHGGFDLRLEGDFGPDEAREVVDRVLATPGDRVAFVMARPATRGQAGRPPRVFVKAEFRRPDEPLSKRLRPSRALLEGRGYRAFAAAGLTVPRLFLFGEQSRFRPRAGAIVCTEKIRGLDAARIYRRAPDLAVGVRVVETLAAVHAAGLVHGDAVLRNFVPMPDRVVILDLPRWARWRRELAERDLALLLGSAMKLGAPREHAERLLAAYRDAPGRPTAHFGAGWEWPVLRQAESYRAHLLERDATRVARHARRDASPVKPRPRTL